MADLVAAREVTKMYFHVYPVMLMSGFPAIPPCDMYNYGSVKDWAFLMNYVYSIIQTTWVNPGPGGPFSAYGDIPLHSLKVVAAYTPSDKVKSVFMSIFSGRKRVQGGGGQPDLFSALFHTSHRSSTRRQTGGASPSSRSGSSRSGSDSDSEGEEAGGVGLRPASKLAVLPPEARLAAAIAGTAAMREAAPAALALMGRAGATRAMELAKVDARLALATRDTEIAGLQRALAAILKDAQEDVVKINLILSRKRTVKANASVAGAAKNAGAPLPRLSPNGNKLREAIEAALKVSRVRAIFKEASNERGTPNEQACGIVAACCAETCKFGSIGVGGAMFANRAAIFGRMWPAAEVAQRSLAEGFGAGLLGLAGGVLRFASNVTGVTTLAKGAAGGVSAMAGAAFDLTGMVATAAVVGGVTVASVNGCRKACVVMEATKKQIKAEEEFLERLEDACVKAAFEINRGTIENFTSVFTRALVDRTYTNTGGTVHAVTPEQVMVTLSHTGLRTEGEGLDPVGSVMALANVAHTKSLARLLEETEGARLFNLLEKSDRERVIKEFERIQSSNKSLLGALEGLKASFEVGGDTLRGSIIGAVSGAATGSLSGLFTRAARAAVSSASAAAPSGAVVMAAAEPAAVVGAVRIGVSAAGGAAADFAAAVRELPEVRALAAERAVPAARAAASARPAESGMRAMAALLAATPELAAPAAASRRGLANGSARENRAVPVGNVRNLGSGTRRRRRERGALENRRE